MNSIDVLNLEWTSSPSRDRVMATLVCNYLRFLGYRVVEASVFDGYHLINKLKPKLFFITNTIGAPENISLMKYAKSRGMLGVSLISEGNFYGDSKFYQEMIWGWNKEKKLAEDIHIQWTERTRQITLEQQPELHDRVRVSGGVGFDNYIISPRRDDKEEILKKYNKNSFKKIIGVGCWDFGCLYREDSRFNTVSHLYTGEQIHRFREDGIRFDKILFEVALLNPDILFLVKHHPGLQLGHKGAGTESIANLANVLIVKNEIPIFNCISLCDFWLVYESTTALEAWLLGKETCLLNPSGRDFPRDIVNIGSPHYEDANQVNAAINNFYKYEHLPGFDERTEERKSVVQNIIQWDDGLNHVRAGNEIIEKLESADNKLINNDNLKQLMARWKQHTKWKLSPYTCRVKASTNYWANRKNFNELDLETFAKIKYLEQISFYKTRGLSSDQLRKIRGL